MAEETVVEFANYLRGNLDSLTMNEPIPFENELRHVETYLAIEKKRFGNKLNVVYDIKVKNFTLPALTLQAVAENAVRHGITKKEGGGTVTVATDKIDGSNLITVVDDGVGFDLAEFLESHDASERNRLGIGNIRRSLAAMCGGTLEIQSTSGLGTTAVIAIPD
jgi:LytS/YehU family sensor histidine kinase